MTAAELCDVVYSRQVSWLVLKTACAHITSQHFAKMTEEGRVVREEGRALWGVGPLVAEVSAGRERDGRECGPREGGPAVRAVTEGGRKWWRDMTTEK